MAFDADHPVIPADDLNGDYFLIGGAGETEEQLRRNRVLFVAGCPRPNDQGEGNHQNWTPAIAHSFISINHSLLCQEGLPAPIAAKVSYLRMLCAVSGYISPEFSLDAHHVRYNDSVLAPADDHFAAAEFNPPLADPNAVVAYATDVARDWRVHLTAGVRSELKKNFTNMLCCVAYMFRTRAHHYMPELAEKYANLWIRCQKNGDPCGIPWEYIATAAFHAVMPDVLDRAWAVAVANQRCAGTLVVRYQCAAAGTAGVAAVEKAVPDVAAMLPGAFNHYEEQLETVHHAYGQLQGNDGRWRGAINRRYYDGAALVIPEAEISIIGSICLGVYEELANDAPIAQSPALIRLAGLHPILKALAAASCTGVVNYLKQNGAKMLIQDEEEEKE
jgi:hypothetical protein